MAEGDFRYFNQFRLDLWNEIHDVDDAWYLAYVTSSVTPAIDDAAPHWNGTGTTDYSTNEVTAGGNYSAGGILLANVAVTVSAAGVETLDFDNAELTANGSNPTNLRWGIIYNSTDANNRCMGFVDLGSVRDASAGTVTTAPAATGVSRIGVGTIS